jgi:hypothetical protein
VANYVDALAVITDGNIAGFGQASRSVGAVHRVCQ